MTSARENAALLLGALVGEGIDPDLVYSDLRLVHLYPASAEFEMLRTEPNGQTISFPISFARDEDGVWRIKSF